MDNEHIGARKEKHDTFRRGFVTIATGDDKYYWMALNLLHSYRVNGGCDLPFAIICDKDCPAAREFDDMILMPDTTYSYLDKLQLNRYVPYDETIFIDADILILGDVNILWDDFAPMDDFSCYGRWLPLEAGEGWFCYKDMGELKPRIHHGISMHGGVYYLRKTGRCNDIFDCALEVAKNYHKYKFYYFKDPADEPVLALTMVLTECPPCSAEMGSRIRVLPAHEGKLRISRDGKLMLENTPCITRMLHFGNRNTKRFLYHYLLQGIDNMRKTGHAEVSVYTRFMLQIKCMPYELKFALNRFVRKILPAMLRRMKHG